ncbi:uncharacterized protein RCH25_043537 [Pelodytes ibericus]
MKSPPTETGPPKPESESKLDTETDKQPEEQQKTNGESEKDSGFSDSSSEGFSSEETACTAAATTAPERSPEPAQVQAPYAPIYILQNIVLKQPRILLFQPPVRRHRKRSFPSSYLPILRSYPKIAPRLAPLPTSSPNPSSTDHSPAPAKHYRSTSPKPSHSATPKHSRTPLATHLLEVSLRSLALLRRTRETQRSIRQLRAHTRLYNRAMQGEEGGWDRLRREMERSGVYKGGMATPVNGSSLGDDSSVEEDMSESENEEMPSEKPMDLSVASMPTEVTTKGGEVDCV